LKIKLAIPDIPPSNNKFIGRNARGFHFVYQEEKRKWEWMVRAAVKKKPQKPFKKARVRITYFFPNKIRRDPDNYSGKFLLDGLRKAELIEDDSFSNIILELAGSYDSENPRTEIELEEIE